MKKIAVLMTCFNRRETTLRCLRSLCPCASVLNFDVFLVDDGSTDGTGEAVRKEFPFVKILQTGGGFYWAKGMELAWESAISHVEHGEHVEYDGFLWLNDDTMLHADTMARLDEAIGENPEVVIVGSLRDADTGKKTCGIKGDGTFTGNFTYVPRCVYEKVGMLRGACELRAFDLPCIEGEVGRKVVSC